MRYARFFTIMIPESILSTLAPNNDNLRVSTNTPCNTSSKDKTPKPEKIKTPELPEDGATQQLYKYTIIEDYVASHKPMKCS